MIDFLVSKCAALQAWFAVLFARPGNLSPLVEIPETTPASPPPVRTEAHRSPRRPVNKDSGAFMYFDTLLDQLPTCRKLLRKMRSIDANAYEYNALVGARVLPSVCEIWGQPKLSPAFISRLPSTGMVYVPPDKDDKVKYPDWAGVLAYFTKLEKTQANMVAPQDATAVYRMTVVSLDWKTNRGSGAEFAVAIIDGKPRLLSERHVEKVRLPKGGSFARFTWGYSPNLEWWFHSHQRKKRDKEYSLDFLYGKSVQEFGANLFVLSANDFASSAGENFQVRAERDGVSVAFSISLGRTPYFFKDRDRAVNQNGKTLRIFHQVAGHKRVTPTGKTVDVREHYRGLRRFMWHGEKIVVTAPKQSLMTVDVKAIEVDDPTKHRGNYTQAQFGRTVRDYLESDEALRLRPRQGRADA